MYGPSGNQLVLFFVESWSFPPLRLGKHGDSRDNKTDCFPWNHTLSASYLPKCMEVCSISWGFAIEYEVGEVIFFGCWEVNTLQTAAEPTVRAAVKT